MISGKEIQKMESNLRKISLLQNKMNQKMMVRVEEVAISEFSSWWCSSLVHLEESVQTLEFALRARNVKTRLV